ncbi:MAG: hypothetical protein V7K47_15150 [Nostoc sp.]
MFFKTDKSKNILLFTVNGHQSSVNNFKPDNLYHVRVNTCHCVSPWPSRRVRSEAIALDFVIASLHFLHSLWAYHK